MKFKKLLKNIIGQPRRKTPIEIPNPNYPIRKPSPHELDPIEVDPIRKPSPSEIDLPSKDSIRKPSPPEHDE